MRQVSFVDRRLTLKGNYQQGVTFITEDQCATIDRSNHDVVSRVLRSLGMGSWLEILICWGRNIIYVEFINVQYCIILVYGSSVPEQFFVLKIILW